MKVTNSLFLIVLLLSSAIIGPLSSNSDNLPVAFAEISEKDIENIGNYVIFGFDKVEIKKDVAIQSGNIGLHDDSKKKGEIKIKKDVTFADPESSIVANKIKIEKDAVAPNVYYNELDNKGEIFGIDNTPLILPVVNNLPEFPVFEAGDEKIKVDKNESLTLSPGDYEKIELKKNSILIFEGGIYNIKSLKSEKDSQILFDSASEIRIEKELKIGDNAELKPSPSSSITASDIVIFVGSNVDIHKNSVINANIFAPNGEIKMHKGTTATGSFVANKVKIDNNSTLTLDSQFGIMVLTEEFEDTFAEINALSELIEQDSDAAIFESVTLKIKNIQSIVTELENSGIDVEIEVIEQSPQQLKINFNKSGVLQKALFVVNGVCGIVAVEGVSEYYTDDLIIPDLGDPHEKSALALIMGQVCEKSARDAFDSYPENSPQVERFLENIGLYLIGEGSAFDIVNSLNQPFIRVQMIDVSNNISNLYSSFIDQVVLVESVITNVSAIIMGVVFDDDDASQIQDETEGTLSDWQITLTDLETGLILDTTLTDFNGRYVFAEAATASTKVEAEIKIGTEQTLPDPTGLTGGTYHVNIKSKSFPGETTILDFGNRLIPTLSSGPDIVVSLRGGIKILNSDTSGSLSISQEITNTPNRGAQNINSGDFNVDGNTDLLFFSLFPSSTWLALNNGDGTLGPITVDESGILAPGKIGNFNNDGIDDYVGVDRIGTSAIQKLVVYTNDGTGKFTLFESNSIPFQTNSLAVGDVNGDGLDDVVSIAGGSRDKVTIHFGNGNGLSFSQELSVKENPDFATFADMNNDGHLDIVFGITRSEQVGILLNDGTGKFGPLSRYTLEPIPDPLFHYTRQLAIADIDNDGNLDIVYPSRVSGSIAPTTTNHIFSIFLGNSDGTLDPVIEFEPPNSCLTEGIDLGDLNSDGNVDMILACANNNRTVKVYHGDGDANFTEVGSLTFDEGVVISALKLIELDS
jgi:hypothetical protein